MLSSRFCLSRRPIPNIPINPAAKTKYIQGRAIIERIACCSPQRIMLAPTGKSRNHPWFLLFLRAGVRLEPGSGFSFLSFATDSDDFTTTAAYPQFSAAELSPGKET